MENRIRRTCSPQDTPQHLFQDSPTTFQDPSPEDLSGRPNTPSPPSPGPVTPSQKIRPRDSQDQPGPPRNSPPPPPPHPGRPEPLRDPPPGLPQNSVNSPTRPLLFRPPHQNHLLPEPFRIPPDSRGSPGTPQDPLGPLRTAPGTPQGVLRSLPRNFIARLLLAGNRAQLLVSGQKMDLSTFSRRKNGHVHFFVVGISLGSGGLFQKVDLSTFSPGKIWTSPLFRREKRTCPHFGL